MEVTLAVVQQILVMFLLMLVGVVCYKCKYVDNTGKKQLNSLLLLVAMPFVVLDAYINSQFDENLIRNLLIAFALAISSHIISMVVAFLFIPKKSSNVVINRFAIMYSNCGFMAIPLIQSVFGSEGVFYASAYITVFNLLVWTQGYIMFSGKADKQTIIKAFTSPVVISIVVGLSIYFMQIEMPTIISSFVGIVSTLNTPIAMIIMGISMAQVNIIKLFKEVKLYWIALLINLIVPIITMGVYLFLPINPDIIAINLIAVACPTAISTLLFATQFKQDEQHATKVLTISNVLSLVTLPFIVWLYYFMLDLV